MSRKRKPIVKKSEPIDIVYAAIKEKISKSSADIRISKDGVKNSIRVANSFNRLTDTYYLVKDVSVKLPIILGDIADNILQGKEFYYVINFWKDQSKKEN